jgi:hypothetical protein
MLSYRRIRTKTVGDRFDESRNDVDLTFGPVRSLDDLYGFRKFVGFQLLEIGIVFVRGLFFYKVIHDAVPSGEIARGGGVAREGDAGAPFPLSGAGEFV